jgi:hypothetical protein
MTITEYTYEGAVFEIEYEVNSLDEPTETWTSIWSIKHKGVEFMDILSKDLIMYFEEQLDKTLMED